MDVEPYRVGGMPHQVRVTFNNVYSAQIVYPAAVTLFLAGQMRNDVIYGATQLMQSITNGQTPMPIVTTHQATGCGLTF